MKKTNELQDPPFPVGTRVKYLGTREARKAPDGMFNPREEDYTPLIFKGMIAEITKVYPPSKGLGVVGKDEDGEPLIDYDSNGCSVYTNEYGNSRLIHPEDVGEWEIVS